mgnify:FL=1
MKRLTPREAASVVRVHLTTIYRWIESGRLPIHRTVSGQIRIEESALWQREEPHGQRQEHAR